MNQPTQIRLIRHLGDHTDLGMVRRVVLVFLYTEGAHEHGEIARELVIQKPTVTSAIKGLEAGGWVSRAVSSSDRRRVKISVTEKTRRVLSDCNVDK